MRVELKPHPDAASSAVSSIEAEVARDWTYGVAITFRVRGDLSRICLPGRAEPKHVDGLWRTTCFEVFLGDAGGEAYCEFNLSPSTEFASYEFDRYREGMTGGSCAPPAITTSMRACQYELSTELNFRRAVKVHGEGPLRLGVSAVIEEASGAKSYWALAHPPGKPDFHHADSFALELA